VYLLRCADCSLYCGITTELDRRVLEHNSSPKSARYTRSRRPVALVWSEKKRTKSAALKREWRIKQWSKAAKEKFVLSFTQEITLGAIGKS